MDALARSLITTQKFRMEMRKGIYFSQQNMNQ